MSEEKLKSYYRDNFKKYGVHENSLGWTKGKQFVRFYNLTKSFNLESSSIIDIGCGFGDFLKFLNANKLEFGSYTGIDLTEEFINVAKNTHQEENASFQLGNYSEITSLSADYLFGSGIFGHKLFKSEEEQYVYIKALMTKALSEASVGISFDFITDKVDYRTSSEDFHASPSKILEIGYGLSRNIILDNSYMPFEFAITIFKDDSFKVEQTVFNKFLRENSQKKFK